MAARVLLTLPLPKAQISRASTTKSYGNPANSVFQVEIILIFDTAGLLFHLRLLLRLVFRILVRFRLINRRFLRVIRAISLSFVAFVVILAFLVLFLHIHLLSIHFLSIHFLSTHFLSTHFLSTHFLSTHFLSTHFLSIHFLSVDFMSIDFLPTPFPSIHIPSQAPHIKTTNSITQSLDLCLQFFLPLLSGLNPFPQFHPFPYPFLQLLYFLQVIAT